MKRQFIILCLIATVVLGAIMVHLLILYFLFLNGFSNSIVIEPNWMQADIPEDITNNISFMYYYGKTIDDYITIPYEQGLTILDQQNYNTSLKTVIYLHGWSERPSVHKDYSTDIIAAAFLKAQTANLIVVNYENLVKHYYNISYWSPTLLNMGAGYVNAVGNATLIGTALGRFLQNFIEECSCHKYLHIIGFSLGAQIMSYAAVYYGQGRLKRLTALDPAGPIFQIPGHSSLSQDDAVFVDVIHTDGGKLGYLNSIGTADFYPNLGSAPQPHCTPGTDTSTIPVILDKECKTGDCQRRVKCSHYMSVEYYAGSILNPETFLARSCFNRIMWILNMCNNDDHITYMGYYVDTKAKGNYYLNTNINSPYGQN